MDIENQLGATENPTGGAEPSELAAQINIPEGDAAPPESEVQGEEQVDQDPELAALQAELEATTDPEVRKATQSKVNHRFAQMRREAKTLKERQREIELEAARWRGRAEALETFGKGGQPVQAEPQFTPAKVELPPKPQKDDFEDEDGYLKEDEYSEAMAKWGGQVALAEAKAAQEAETQRQTFETEKQRRERWFADGESKYPGEFPTRDRSPDLDISAVMAEAIVDSEVGHDIAYFLGKNPKEATRIAKLSPVSQVREIGKLEARMLSPKAPDPIKKPSAPAPIAPITGATATIAPLEKLSTEEYIARRNREEYGENWKGRRT